MVDSTTDLMGEEETDRKIKDDYKIESVIGKGTFVHAKRDRHPSGPRPYQHRQTCRFLRRSWSLLPDHGAHAWRRTFRLHHRTRAIQRETGPPHHGPPFRRGHLLPQPSDRAS